MNYNSTRDKSKVVSAAQAIAQGISDEGGLFVPQSLPKYTLDDIKALSETDYRGRAKKIFADFLGDFTEQEINESVDAAYTAEKFGSDDPAPISYIESGNTKMSVLELWHGPTCAFKDMALQILPHLLTKSVKKVYSGKEAVILVATSGDTGKAALEGFKDVDGTKIMVFYPVNGVSPMQKRQMATQKGNNVSVAAIEGNFDDAQTGVKKIFTNADIKAKLAENNMLFSSANSINWGRLLPQVVYYFSAYCDMLKEGKIALGDKINVVVPTGNFGNILASYYAMNMGLPIKKFICASNSNNVLTDFIKTGTYDKKRKFYTTISPSMDILVSSNLERLLYHLTDGNAEKIADWMKQLSENGEYTVDEDVKAKLGELFYGGYCDDENTKKTIGDMYKNENYLCDTHTAVAVNVYQQYVEETNDTTAAVIASTASPYKFAKSVLEAVSDKELPDDEFAMTEFLSADKKATKEDSELKMVYTHGKKRNAIANAVIQEGNGTITVNRVPIQNLEPKTLRVKIFEPILILGVDKFKDLKIRVRVSGGGSVAQLYAARTAIAKGIVAWNQKYVDEETKDEARKNLLNYDKNLLVADYRRLEPKKYGGPGARSRKQKSYR